MYDILALRVVVGSGSCKVLQLYTKTSRAFSVKIIKVQKYCYLEYRFF